MTYSDRFRLRAWSKEEKEMYYDVEGQYDNCCNGMGTMAHQCLTDLLEDDRYIVEQCTGLKDKNGRLIYEGDIITPTLDYNEDKVVAEIKFGNANDYLGFYPRWHGKYVEETKYNPGWRKDLYFWLEKGIEVVGNIHENPALLEEEKNEQKEIGAA